MQFHLLGQMRAELCAQCLVPLHHAVVQVFRQDYSEGVVNQVLAAPKQTLRRLKPDELTALAPRLLGSAQVGEDGRYTVRFDAENKADNTDAAASGAAAAYRGEPVLVVVSFPFVHPMDGPTRSRETLSYAVTTIRPEWAYSRDQAQVLARFDHCFAERTWCEILRWFDIWVISGRVANCDDRHLPAVGVRVTALDADFLTDDELGSAVADGDGRFRIYYRSADFKRTFLSPLINIETLGPAGPDVYFRITALDGTELLAESRNDGRQPGRADAPNCLCVDLCIDDSGTPDVDALVWTSIGSLTLSTQGNPNQFTGDGYALPSAPAASKQFALTGVLALTGQKPNPLDVGNGAVYRFLVSTTSSDNSLAGLPAALFAQVVGVTPGLFASVRLGRLVRFAPAPLRLVDVFLDSADLDAQGWVDVRRAVARTLTAHPDFEPADLTAPGQFWQWQDDDAMMGLDSRALTAQATRADLSALKPGEDVPVASRYAIERVALRFEIRDAVTATPLPGDGLSLNALVLNNDAAVIRLGVKRFDGTAVVCDKFQQEDVYVAYTAYHPHLERVAISVGSAGGGYAAAITDAPLPFNNNPRPGVDHAADLSTLLVPRPTVSCNYTVALSWGLLLHTGYGQIPAGPATVPFYFEA